MHGTTVKKKT